MDIQGAYDAWPALDEQDVVVVYTSGTRKPYRVEYVEPLPASVPLRQNLGAVNAGATVQKVLITGIQLNDNVLLQCRIKPIDDIDLLLFLQQGTAKFWIRNSQATVNLFTQIVDPEWKTTTFFVMGRDKDLYVQVNNVTQYNLVQSRLQVWGWRANVTPLDDDTHKWRIDVGQKALYQPGSTAPVVFSPWNGKRVLWVSAEGQMT